MTILKLSYFDINGGRAEPIRLALALGNIAFEDHRFSFDEFAEQRLKMPLGQVPVLAVDNVQITQTNAMLRYAGKQAKLYPSDAYQALLCDEVLDTVEDCINKIVPSMFLSGEEQKLAREQLVQKDLPKYFGFLGAKLLQQKSGWFADQQLTIAELKLSALVGWINSGGLDHVPTDLIASIAPNLNKSYQRVAEHEGVKAYYASL